MGPMAAVSWAGDRLTQMLNGLADASWLQRAASVGAVLLVHFVLEVSSTTQKCNTFDELAHLTSGVSNWLYNDYRLNPEGGTLSQRWAALPVLLKRFAFPDRKQDAWQNGEVFSVGYTYFYAMSNDLGSLLLRSRTMIALLSVTLGLLVYIWSRRLFGYLGGLLSLLVFAFSPTVLGHGRLVTADLCLSLFLLLATAAIWHTMHRLTPLTWLGAAFATAGLLLSKMSGVLIIPLAALLLLVRLFAGRPMVTGTGRRIGMVRGRFEQALWLGGAALACGLVCWAGLWVAYGFHYGASAEADDFHFSWDGVLGQGPVEAVVAWAREHQLVPEAYLYGLAYVRSHSERRVSFLNGQTSSVGFPGFFLFAFLYKTPLPTLGLLLLLTSAAVWTWYVQTVGARWPTVRKHLYAIVPLVALISVYGGVALTTSLNIGHRHILPVYPALFILFGAVARWVRGSARRSAAVLLLVAALVVESLLTWPHYLAYFNSLAGGPSRGYRHLIDSSLDWGQDLPGLKRWLEHHGPADSASDPVYLSYFGTGDWTYYGIRAQMLPCFAPRARRSEPTELTGGIYCISATMVQPVYYGGRGPWCAQYEHAYQSTLKRARQVFATRHDPEARQALINDKGQAYWRQVLDDFEQLRLSRLCHFLRQREPDHQVGHSINIYRLSDDDVRVALYGEPPRMRATVDVRGVGPEDLRGGFR